jgi:hypothetical protein
VGAFHLRNGEVRRGVAQMKTALIIAALVALAYIVHGVLYGHAPAIICH